MISIEGVLLNKPYLRLIEHDVCSIADRIKEIEKEYFIVFNVLRDKYEVHSTANIGHDTYCFTVPYKELDGRTLEYCRQTRNDRNVNHYCKMKEKNEMIKRKKEKGLETTLNDASRETSKATSLAMEKDELHEGYKRTVIM
ncbi:MAG: hypothetical protein ACK5MV_00050 [Aminipila sp.]